MSLRTLSVLAFALMVLGIAWLATRQHIFARSLPFIAVQVAAAVLMVWARIVFGRRSFHAAANPTEGGIVTTGPYHFIRHPIYSAAIYFVWAAALDNRTWAAAAAAAVVTAGAAMRMYAEESLLLTKYPQYAEYARRTARVVPFLV